MKSDSIDGIYDTLKQCALISKSAGGIGVVVSSIRAKVATLEAPTGIPMDWFRCCETSVRPLGTSIRAVESARELSHVLGALAR